MAYIDKVTNLSNGLIYVGALQIGLTCFLAFAFSQFMSVLHCNIPTAAGLLTAFITVPTIVQLRTSQLSRTGPRKYGYAIWYKRLAISTCTILQTISLLLTIINLLSFKTSQDSFLKVMQNYGNKQSSKSIVDNVQWFLQCCGKDGYRDWYDVNWGNFIVDPFHSKKKKAIELLLSNDIDEYPDLTTMRTDAVPFSCCAEVASSACIHQNLEQFGTYTINTEGCGYQLDATKITILSSELIIYSLGLLIEISILSYLFKMSESYEKKFIKYEKVPSPAKFKIFHESEKKEFSKFLNDNSSTARSEI